MSLTRTHITWFGVGALWTSTLGAPAIADDTELFVGDSTTITQGQPNILFVLDNSASMGASVSTRAPYDPAFAYSGSCSSGRVYWKSGSDPNNPPDCASTDRWFNASALVCDAAVQSFASTGFRQDRAAQFDAADDIRWEGLSIGAKDALVECQSDSPTVTPPGHGDGSGSNAVYAQDGHASNPWTSVANDEIDWDNQSNYVLYSANYVNWWYNGPEATATRLEIMQAVATDLLDSINGVNVGLMHFNFDEGGLVAHAMEDIATARAGMKAKINGLTASNFTPVSETLYESGLYWMGRPVDNGGDSDPAALGPGGSYQSPLNLSCQRNFAILLTDGAPARDSDRDAEILSMNDATSGSFASLVGGSCDADVYDPSVNPDGGQCLDDLAEILNKGDLSTLPGQQNVHTYTVGFGIDLPVLSDAAERGGGEYRTANDAASLTSVLTDFVLGIAHRSTTFSAPTVSVNSFNRTQNMNDLFISMFSPAANAHWPGNLKKYRLRASDGVIVDANGDPAVDPITGFFAEGAQSFWSPTDDGPNVEAGGASNQIPAPPSRDVYTHFSGNPAALTHAANAVVATNAMIDDALLGTGGAGNPTRAELIDFIRGTTTDGTEARNQMGDPLHSQPVSVVYDGNDPDSAVVYFATNDGYLHAINPSTGVEKWAFVPEEFLGDQLALYENEPTPSKHYGVDGDLSVQILADNDGVIDAGTEKVYLTFGMRRGGTSYYSLDVSNPDNPRLLWRRGAAELTGIGQSWARAVPARIDVDSPAQSSADNLVLVIAGGYDTSQDYYDNIADTAGNSIYIVDSEDGDVLWRGSASGGDKTFADMNSSIPADIKVIDLNTDGLADRMYAADMGGQVWRFDIFNGQTPSNLVAGGVIAQLGAAPLPTNPAAPVADGPDNRRFYYSPDVALVTNPDFNFIHIGIGSGYRAHPLGTVNQDRFYALRDYEMFNQLDDAAYAAITPVTDADLVDVTNDTSANVPQGAPGWKFELRHPAGYVGEKVLAEARTFNNQVFFTTFIPNADGTSVDPCVPAPGLNRFYVMSLFNGSPVTNLDGDATENEEEDRYREFPGTITSEVVFLFPSPDDPNNCVGDECSPPPVACVDLFCFPTGFANNPVRTFWSQENID